MDREELRLRRRKIQVSEEDESASVIKETQPVTQSFYLALFVTLTITLATLLIGYYRSPISAVDSDKQHWVKFTGPFSVNEKLAKGKQIMMDAPESIEEDDAGNLYTGLANGKILKIHPSVDGVLGDGELEEITNGIFPNADTTTQEIAHGRILGIRLRNNSLFVMDAIYGLYKIELASRAITILVRPSDAQPPMKFPDDLDITADGSIIYFTDASYKYPITQLINEGLEGSCTGRLFKYSTATHKLETVVSGLCFANGVQLTKDEQTVIVPETTKFRLLWIDKNTWKIKHVLQLPAMPDNVRVNRQGTYWVGASTKQSKLTGILWKFPFLRQIAVGLLPAKVLYSFLNRKHNMLFEVNDKGEILDTLHDPHGSLTFAVAQGTELSDGRIALGTYAAPFLAIADRSS